MATTKFTASKKFVNLTPHDVAVEDYSGDVVVFPASGVLARVVVQGVASDALIEYYEGCELGAPPATGYEQPVGFRLTRQMYGEVTGLPEAQAGTVFIVSAMVLARVAGRHDVVAPDTGSTAARDTAGRILHVKGFVQ